VNPNPVIVFRCYTQCHATETERQQPSILKSIKKTVVKEISPKEGREECVFRLRFPRPGALPRGYA
jgi:hypothetical protein